MYIPLHVHTEYSVLDGMSSVSELCDRAKELGMPGIAITDHGTMMGVKEFHSYFKSHASGIKPILGSEIYVTAEYDYHLKDSDHRRTFHLILLAKNLAGYRNLCKIVSIAATEGMYNKPRVDLSVLRQYYEGLICMSACIGGEIPQCILDEDIERAEAAILRYREIFGDDFYLEVCIHPNEREGNPQEVVKCQRIAAEAMYALGDKFGIKVVATNDSHFTYKEQAEAHDVMLAVNCNKRVADTDRLHYTGEEYLKSEQEMLTVFPEHPEVVLNTEDVFNKVEYYDIDAPVRVPLPKTINPDVDCDNLLREHAIAGFERLFPFDDDMARKRLQWELDVITERGFSRNFLVMEDIIQFAQAEGITYGPGRGSAAGCLVNYCLGITKINPLKYGLLFERFTYRDRPNAFPGIDIDFEWGGVEKIWRHLQDVYGKDCVAGQVILQQSVFKLLLQKVAAAMGILESVSAPVLREVEKCDRYDRNALRDNRVLSGLLSADDGLRKAYDIAKELQGRKCGIGTHACAILLSSKPISDSAPVMFGNSYFLGGKIPIVQYDKWHADDVGLFRINLLELKTLNIIKDTIKEINADNASPVDITGITDDMDTDMMMYKGNRTGVFLFESEGMNRYLHQFRYCPKFKDLVAMNAMYRPGPMEMIPDYLDWSADASKRTGIAELDEILEETNGVPVYQEQYISFFERFLHKSSGDAVILFKAMAKRETGEMPAYRKEFVAEGLRRHLPERDLEKIWDRLYDNSLYAFMKAHSVCYTALAYQCAYLKAHYPDVFLKYHRKYNVDYDG